MSLRQVVLAASGLMLSAVTSVVSAAQCTSITGGNSSASAISDCRACTTLYPDRAIDADPKTAAMVVVGVNDAGRSGLRATAQRGIVYPAGSRPGALIKVTKVGSVAQDTKGVLSTYLNGKLQDQRTFSAGGDTTVNGVGTLEGLNSLKASKPFNAVEVTFSGVYTNYNLEVFELCSDSKP